MTVKIIRSRPVQKEAIQFDGSEKSFEEINLFTDYLIENPEGDLLLIPTLEGNMKISKGDWVIKGLKGEFYPCKPDVFENTYDIIGDKNEIKKK